MFKKFVSIAPSHRKHINNASEYQIWLSTVKDNDQVLLQEFHPVGDFPLDSPLEYWRFTQVRVWRDELVARGYNNHPFNRQTGKCCYWNSEADWGKVFPARIMPIHYEFAARAVEENGDSFVADRPLFEPNYLQCFRHVLKLDRKTPAQSKVSKIHLYNYSQKIHGGDLLHVFTPEENWTLNIEGLVYLYSEYLRD